VEDDVDRFVDVACEMYEKKEIYRFRNQAFEFLEERCSMDKNLNILKEHLMGLENQPMHDILFGETLRSTVYFSKYIEIKNNRIV
jgi:hypothetical protein